MIATAGPDPDIPAPSAPIPIALSARVLSTPEASEMMRPFMVIALNGSVMAMSMASWILGATSWSLSRGSPVFLILNSGTCMTTS